MRNFSVSYARYNDSELSAGGTTRHGIEASGLSLREAIETAGRVASAQSETRGAYASDSCARAARWITLESWEYVTGDTVESSVHFPTNATPASRARLVRLLAP